MLTISVSLPPQGCAQNFHGHHMVAARAVEAHRKEARGAALAARLAARLPEFAFRRIVVAATWFCAPLAKDGRYRPTDGTNAQGALKAAIDGLVDAGLVGDDDHKRAAQGVPTLLRTAKEHGGRRGVEIRVEGYGAPTEAERAAFRERRMKRAMAAAKAAATRAMKRGRR